MLGEGGVYESPWSCAAHVLTFRMIHCMTPKKYRMDMTLLKKMTMGKA